MRRHRIPFGWPKPATRHYCFPLPNVVWEYKLKPVGFVILSCLCCCHSHHRNDGKVSAEAVAKADTLRPNTLKNYRSYIENHIRPSLGDKQLARITPKDVQRFYEKFHDLRHVFATNALEHGMDVKTLSTIIGHVSSATALNIYAHVTDDMQRQAAVKIGQGTGRTETSSECSATTVSHTVTDFKPKRGRNRYWGSGYLGQIKGGRWNGRYTVTWPDGTCIL